MNPMKQHTTKNFFLLSAILASGLMFSACSSETESVMNEEEAPQSDLISAIVVDVEPAGAISVAEARKSAEPGQPITVTGQIGGTMEPFGANFATLTLGDEAIMFCDEMDDDHCPTPWDACCEDPDKVAASRASVQLLDVNTGNVLRGSFKGVAGLKELDRIVVVGLVDETSTPENLIINARAIYQKPL